MSRNCLFCKIAEKALDARIVYENSKVIAFEDVNPQAPVHVLVIPKKHVGSAAEVLEGEVWADLMGAVTKVARELDLGNGGYRLVINCGAQAGQTIPHLHVHLLAGRSFRWPPG
ncbi:MULTISPECIES: histidine triad nucleotide-binding protein [Aminobacterium]|uniref:histidine triad nucleotide-binding protein n=1 Tax=Aminobacterium TaxID=81466 RepID=UPI00257E1BAD|nr:histidine triad nucleotide-binding protein [Aminobacterium sp. UBA4987]